MTAQPQKTMNNEEEKPTESDAEKPEEQSLAGASCSAIQCLEGVRAFMRDRQYEITLMCDAELANHPIEMESWQRVKRELEAAIDCCNRIIYRMSQESDTRNEMKAYHVATAVSSIVWGGEHGWEDDAVGEYDLANAFREFAKQNDPSEARDQ